MSSVGQIKDKITTGATRYWQSAANYSKKYAHEWLPHRSDWSHLGGGFASVLKEERVVQFQLRHLTSIITAGAIMLYLQARESIKPNAEQEKQLWLKLVAESVGASMLAMYTNLLPVAALGVIAYRTGQQNSAADSIQEALKSSTTIGAGVLGTIGGLIANIKTDRVGGEFVLESIHDLLQIATKGESSEKKLFQMSDGKILAELNPEIEALSRILRETTTQIKASTLFDLSQKSAAHKKMEIALNQAHEVFVENPEVHVALEQYENQHANNPSRQVQLKQFETFLNHLKTYQSQSLQLARWTRPAAYYFLFAIVGGAVGRTIGGWFGNLFPSLKRQQVPPYLGSDSLVALNTLNYHHPTYSNNSIYSGMTPPSRRERTLGII
ncbi:MAG: hypothetical protein KTR14_11425 [Vampirovibrio sp.]|nr:hypothetical protein [Vampirovibrio sp.]